jgi:hypothetical protein
MNTKTRIKQREKRASAKRSKHQSAPVPCWDRLFSPEVKPNSLAHSSQPAWELAQPTHEQVAERAYEVWMARGRPMGTASEDWREAEQTLSDEMRWSESQISF